MKSIRNSIILIFGWCMYYLLKTVLMLFFIWVTNLISQNFFPYSNELYNTIRFFSIAIIPSFLGFVFSIKWFVTPLSSRFNQFSESSSIAYLFGEWLIFILFSWLYGQFPLMILSMFQISKNIPEIIKVVWVAIISIGVYRSLLLNYVHPLLKQEAVSNNELVEIS